MPRKFSVDDKVKFFVAVGEQILKDAKLDKQAVFYVMYIQNTEGGRYVVSIESHDRKTKVGFSITNRHTLKDYQKTFELNLDEFKRKSGAVASSLWGL